MAKVAWTVVTCLYKVSFTLSQYWPMTRDQSVLAYCIHGPQASRAQQELDAEARQLAEEISVMLAYVASCKDLAPVEGRASLVLRAVELTTQGACLIDACMAHRFEGGRPILMTADTDDQSTSY